MEQIGLSFVLGIVRQTGLFIGSGLFMEFVDNQYRYISIKNDLKNENDHFDKPTRVKIKRTCVINYSQYKLLFIVIGIF